MPQCLGGFGAHPDVGVREPAGQCGHGGGGLHAAQSSAGRLALVGTGGVFRHGDKQWDQRRQVRGTQTQLGGGIEPDDRIPLTQGGDQLILGVTSAASGEFRRPDGFFNRLGIKLVRRGHPFSGDAKFLERQGGVQEIIGGRMPPIGITIIPVVVGAARCPLLATLIHERSVTAALHFPIPAQLFEVFACRLRAAHCGAQRRPQVTEPLAGMAVCLALEARKGHPREILRLQWFVTHAREHDSGQAVLAIAAVIIVGPALPRELVFAIIRLVFAVGNGSAVDIVTEEIGCPRDGRINLRIFHACLFAQHDRELGGQPGLIHRPVPTDGSMGAARLPATGRCDRRETVAGRAEHARVFGSVNHILAESVKHLGVVGQHGILGQKDAVIAIPRVNPFALKVKVLGRKGPGIRLQHRQILGVAGCQQGQRADGPRSSVPAPAVLQNLLLETLGGVGHDLRGLGTIEGCRGGICAHDRQGDGHFGGGTRAPALEFQNAVACLGGADRPAQALAGIAGEQWHAAGARTRTENEVVGGHDSGGRGLVGHGGYQNLIGRKRRVAILRGGLGPTVVNPTPHPSRTQVVGISAVNLGKILVHGEIDLH